MKRREFLSAAAAATAYAKAGELPRRPYKDGIRLSIIGYGGIVVVGQEQADANRSVAQAVDNGVNYFDVAPSYGKGEAEEKLGPALKPFRKNVFLACKTQRRDAEGAREELERSLKRLHTDHFDLYQFHAVSSMDDVEKILAPRGAAETFLKAKKEGKVRYLGFSAHNAQAAIALMDRFAVDSILYPVNYILYAQGNFGPQILEHAKKKGVIRLALKAMAKTRWAKGEDRSYRKTWYRPLDEPSAVEKAIRFTLSEDITSAIPPGEEKLFRMAIEAAMRFKPLTAPERKELLAGSAGVEPIFRA
jgi:aryl-alcohol dehydrogenase-like predicted oxidoreductase